MAPYNPPDFDDDDDDDGVGALEHTPPPWAKHLTPTLFYLLLVSTLGPLLFGYHLVSTGGIPPSCSPHSQPD